MTILQNITSSLHNTQATTKSNATSTQRIANERINCKDMPSDIISMSFELEADTTMRVLDAGSGQKALFAFSDATSKVSAYLVDKGGASKSVSQENLPKSFEHIKTIDSFNHYLDNAHVRGTIMSDGSPKIYAEQKGLGGGDKNPAGGGTANIGRFGALGQYQPPVTQFNGNISLPNGIQGVANVATPGVNMQVGVGYSAPINYATSVAFSVTRDQSIGFGQSNSSKPSYSTMAGFRFRF